MLDSLFAFFIATSPLELACQSLLGRRPGFNTTVQDDIWQVGRLPEQHYVVIVPVRSQRRDPSHAKITLETLKHCSSDMFLMESHLGNYIQAGSFYRRTEAEDLSQILRCKGFDARVIYFP